MALRIMIDKEFKSLIQPLRVEEYKNLEESLINEGCRDPIILWNDVIVDGHNRYEICTRLNIPFNTIHKGFSSRAEAISWICLNQLSRRNITEEVHITDSEPQLHGVLAPPSRTFSTTLTV